MSLTAKFSTIVGIEEQLLLNDIVLFPNPAAQQNVLVQLTSVKPQPISFQVIDGLSRPVSSMHKFLGAGAHQVALDVQQMPAGIYTVVLQAGVRKVVKKLVVLR